MHTSSGTDVSRCLRGSWIADRKEGTESGVMTYIFTFSAISLRKHLMQSLADFICRYSPRGDQISQGAARETRDAQLGLRAKTTHNKTNISETVILPVTESMPRVLAFSTAGLVANNLLNQPSNTRRSLILAKFQHCRIWKNGWRTRYERDINNQESARAFYLDGYFGKYTTVNEYRQSNGNEIW